MVRGGGGGGGGRGGQTTEGHMAAHESRVAPDPSGVRAPPHNRYIPKSSLPQFRVNYAEWNQFPLFIHKPTLDSTIN
jgi:hypothetical protein